VSLESHNKFKINWLLPLSPGESAAEPKPVRIHCDYAYRRISALGGRATKLWLRSLAGLPGAVRDGIYWGLDIMKSHWLKVAVVGAVIHMTVVGAFAADLPAAPVYTKAPVPTPVYNWGGWYVGGNVGYGWGDNTNPTVSYVDPGGFFGTAGYFAAGGNVTPNVSPHGVIGGGQIGFNWMLSPNWVGGLVTDLQGSGMKASATNFVAPGGGFTPSNQINGEQINWFGTLRAKMGYAQNNWLLYGTGGLAYGGVNTSGSFNILGIPPATPVPGTNSTTKVGWTAGAGLNYGLTPNWIIGFEYLYVDLGRVSYTETFNVVPVLSVNTVSNRAAANIARVSLDYKF
jgi:outer membrane immunogenic protein